jgi:hypothetical protein
MMRASRTTRPFDTCAAIREILRRARREFPRRVRVYAAPAAEESALRFLEEIGRAHGHQEIVRSSGSVPTWTAKGGARPILLELIIVDLPAIGAGIHELEIEYDSLPLLVMNAA